MALDHYLPATYIGLFSSQDTLPRRNRLVYAGDRKQDKIIKAPAGKLAREKDFYGLRAEGVDPSLIDDVWAEYESNLASALDNLINGTVDGLTWARTLVPFVACLLVRGPDFNVRFDRRINELGIETSDEQTNMARIFELQRLLGPVAVADWIMSNVHGEGDLITNDLGFAPFIYGPTGEIGLSIPISHRQVLQIIPKRSRRIVVARKGEWFPRIRYFDLSPGNHLGFNDSLGKFAQRFIFGAKEEDISQNLFASEESPTIPEPFHLGFISGPLAVAHEFTWHRLVGALTKQPTDDPEDLFEFDVHALAGGWAPPIYFPTNLPEFPPCLTKKGNIIEATFYEVDGFTK